MKTPRKAVLAGVLLAMAGTATASDSVPTASLRPAADREACASENLMLDGAKSQLALCVKSAMFRNDEYMLKIDGQSVATGIDDETTHGVTGQFGDRPVGLVCTPVHEKRGEPTPGLVEAFMKKGMSEEQARKTADLTTTVEAARDCAVSVSDTVRWNVRVQF